jgi:hypothetical protein
MLRTIASCVTTYGVAVGGGVIVGTCVAVAVAVWVAVGIGVLVTGSGVAVACPASVICGKLLPKLVVVTHR